jgi:hypothetical protein
MSELIATIAGRLEIIESVKERKVSYCEDELLVTSFNSKENGEMIQLTTPGGYIQLTKARVLELEQHLRIWRRDEEMRGYVEQSLHIKAKDALREGIRMYRTAWPGSGWAPVFNQMNSVHNEIEAFLNTKPSIVLK